MTEPAKPGIFDRLRTRYGWLDHVACAYRRFSDSNGSFLAAGLTYYTIFAIFPLLMVGFAVVGFALAQQPRLLQVINDRIRESVTGELGQQLIDVMNSAIAARASVGVIGLATATWAGLNWMSHLREALSAMWEHSVDTAGFVRTKLSDLTAMAGTFAIALSTVAITALGHAAPMAGFLRWLGVPQFPVFDLLFRGISVLVSLLVSWLLFTWMIGRLPREPVRLVTAMKAGFMAATGFEVFKQLGSIYLQVVLRSPAGVAFGPVLGLMVFGFITAFLVLFATAWAATADPRTESVEPPAPAIIRPRVLVNEGLSTRQALTAMFVGAVGALTFSRLTRSGRHKR